MYKFSLQRVLDLRIKAEEQKAIVLAAANEGAQHAREAYQTLTLDRTREHAHFDAMQRIGATAGELQGLRQVLEFVDAQLGRALERVEQADQDAAERFLELQDASRDRRVIERLREKDLQAWRAKEARQDAKQMDEIATQRFARNRY